MARKGDVGYDEYRQKQAGISRERSQAGREIGAVPDIADPGRRESCRESLRLFCETYNPEAFSLGWSTDHLAAIARIEEAATAGALYAFAMPRGSGKSTICRMAALWAVSYALKRYVYLIGASAEKGEDSLDAVKTYVRFLPLYAADFPEISWPAQCLAGIAQRASGQTCGGESTSIEWGKGRVILPTVPPPGNWPKAWPLRADGNVPTSGAVLGVSGLTGEGIRGSNLTLTTGEAVRPDFVLLDDPQTDESARSRSQNTSREALIAGAVLGMAGPGKAISAVMPCTVIAPGDMVDRLLDRSKHPLWRGHRTRMLRTMPDDMDAWREYFDVYYDCALLEPPDFTAANAYYLTRRKALEAGAEASWPERKEPWEVSAVQHAMHIFARGERAFYAEYQNEPQTADAGLDSKEFDPPAVAARVNGVERFAVPKECQQLTAFVDVGRGSLHWYAVVAWNDRGGGAVVDYGCWPRQSRTVFEASDARPSLRDRYPGLSDSQLVFAGLRDLTAEILPRAYYRDGSGDEMRVERCLIDSGYEQAAVMQFIRQSPSAGIILPSKGVGRTTASRGVSEWKPRPGERAGYHWRLTVGEQSRTRQVIFDPDAWKSRLHELLTTPPGDGRGLFLYGKSAGPHELLSEHLAAEYSHPITLRGTTFDKWEPRPDRRDNHLLDCLVGAAVAAGVLGVSWSASPRHEPPAPKQPKRAWGDKYKDKFAAWK